jgi:hypothetical protein
METVFEEKDKVLIKMNLLLECKDEISVKK